MFWLVNDSPFAGTEGKYVTSRNIKDRLDRELRKDVALRVREIGQADRFEVAGRVELHLSILAENMRREGYEFALSRPQVILKNINGQTMEPYEALVADIEEAHVGPIMEKLQQRRAEMTDMVNPGTGGVRIEFKIPTRSLFGIRTEFLSETRGTGLLYHTFLEYGPYRGELAGRNRGALLAKEGGDTTAYVVEPLQERSTLFINPGLKVYGGMIVGENSRDSDMVVQVCRAKHLTNMRASGSDIAVRLTPPRQMTLEQCLEWIEDDELVEVTPESIRIRIGREKGQEGGGRGGLTPAGGLKAVYVELPRRAAHAERRTGFSLPVPDVRSPDRHECPVLQSHFTSRSVRNYCRLTGLDPSPCHASS